MTAEHTAGVSEASTPPNLRRDLEAVLMVVDQPVSEYDLARAMDVPLDAVTRTLEELSREYTEQGRGFDLRAVAEGWRVYTRPECADIVEHFLKEGQEVRLTQAALETMAVVAYRQPVSRGRVSAVRGVNCDGVMRTLVLRGLIEEAGHDPESAPVPVSPASHYVMGGIATDLEGRVIYANATAERLYGWEPGEMVGRPSFLHLDIRLDGDSWNVRVGGGVRIVGEGVFRLPD
jgi:segregation and condensation protein B